MPSRPAFREIQDLLGLTSPGHGAGGSVYRDEVAAVAERVGVPYKERVKTWRAIMRALGIQPESWHTSTEGTITDSGFLAVRDRLLELEQADGSIPNPITDFASRPLHLLLRWEPGLNSQTLNEHRKVVEEHGAVWYGKLGNQNKAAVSGQKLATLKQQVASQVPTHVYFYRPGELWRARLLEILADASAVDTSLVPAYYQPDGSRHLWLKVTAFESLPASWAHENLVFAETGEPVGFKGQASLYSVKAASEAAPRRERYFIFNHGKDEHQAAHGDELGKRLGFDFDVSGRLPLLDAQKGRFVYYQTSAASTGASGSFIGTGRIVGVDVESDGDDGKQRWAATLTDYEAFANPVPRSQYEPAGWNVQHGISEISQDAYGRILALGNDAEPPVEFSFDMLRDACVDEGLILGDDTYRAVVAAIRAKKHVIFTGPPGTAKTTLAEATAALAARAQMSSGHVLTTATADWTTYETIGGLRPSGQGTSLEFRDGQFLAAARAGKWLVIDELNRSNFDRAFGQFFTVLSGQSIVLPYEDATSDKPIALIVGDAVTPYDSEEYSLLRIPATWRIVATMNVFDKSLLFEMSFALMRRFAFIEVPAPNNAVYKSLWAKETESLETTPRALVDEALSALLKVRSLKEIGPAVFLDMARFAGELTVAGMDSAEELVYQLFYSYLLPQFEGIDDRQGATLLALMSPSVGAHKDRLRRTLNEVLGLALPGIAAAPPAPPAPVSSS